MNVSYEVVEQRPVKNWRKRTEKDERVVSRHDTFEEALAFFDANPGLVLRKSTEEN